MARWISNCNFLFLKISLSAVVNSCVCYLPNNLQASQRGCCKTLKKFAATFFLFCQTAAEYFSFFLAIAWFFTEKILQFTYNKQVGIAFIETIKAIPAKVFGADFISLRRAKKWGSAVAKGYGGTRWGKEPFFKKVFFPQNSFPFFTLCFQHG